MIENDSFEKNITYKLEIIKSEYAEIQRIIARMDNISFTVKGWAITLLTALVTLGSDKLSRSIFLLISIGLILLFVLIDICYKGMMDQLRERIKFIEDVLGKVDFSDIKTLKRLLEVKSPCIDGTLKVFTPSFIFFKILKRLHVIGLLYIGMVILAALIAKFLK